MEFPVTAQQVRQTVIDHGITHLPHHDCSICGAWTKYVFVENTIGEIAPFYDSNCSCSDRWSPRTARSWNEVAEFINQRDTAVAQSIWDRMMAQATKISDERLAEIASAANHLTAHSPHPRITVAEAAKLVTELQHRREAEAGLSYAQIIAIVDDCSERMKKAGESHRMLAKWISEGIHAASPSSPASGVRVSEEELIKLAGEAYDKVLAGDLPDLNPFAAVVRSVLSAIGEQP